MYKLLDIQCVYINIYTVILYIHIHTVYLYSNSYIIYLQYSYHEKSIESMFAQEVAAVLQGPLRLGKYGNIRELVMEAWENPL